MGEVAPVACEGPRRRVEAHFTVGDVDGGEAMVGNGEGAGALRGGKSLSYGVVEMVEGSSEGGVVLEMSLRGSATRLAAGWRYENGDFERRPSGWWEI